MLDDLWAQIVEVHNEAKTLFLLAEEIEPNQFRDFIQPINEHRHSLEHIVRAQANVLGIDPDGVDESYQEDSLRKALGHEYRAFFDCADWIAIILREEISDTLTPYDAACIKEVLPEYYSRLRSRITEISTTIARKRGEKNVSRTGRVIEDVRAYKLILGELQEIHSRVVGAQEALADYRSRIRRTSTKETVKSVLCALILAAITGVGGFLWGKVTAKPSSTTPHASPQDNVVK
jgi:hypothetical protein